MNWYYLQEGKATGPLSETALREMAACGIIQDATLVCQEGEENWTEFSSLPAKKPKTAPPSSVEEYKQLFKDTSRLCKELYRRAKQSPITQRTLRKLKVIAGRIHKRVTQLIQARRTATSDTKYAGPQGNGSSAPAPSKKGLSKAGAIGLGLFCLFAGTITVMNILDHFDAKRTASDSSWDSSHRSSTKTTSSKELQREQGSNQRPASRGAYSLYMQGYNDTRHGEVAEMFASSGAIDVKTAAIMVLGTKDRQAGNPPRFYLDPSLVDPD